MSPERFFNPAARRAGLLGLMATALLAGCASTRIDAQWSDPQFGARSLRGMTLLVVCEAPDATTQQLCQQQLAAQVTALGATARIAPAIANPQPGREQATTAYLPAARAVRAGAVFSAAVLPEAALPRGGPSIGIGVGGFGGGRVGVGGGIGISLPIGGGDRAASGLALSGALTDVSSGRLMWSSRASTPPAAPAAQLRDLTAAVAEAAQRAGFF